MPAAQLMLVTAAAEFSHLYSIDFCLLLHGIRESFRFCNQIYVVNRSKIVVFARRILSRSIKSTSVVPAGKPCPPGRRSARGQQIFRANFEREQQVGVMQDGLVVVHSHLVWGKRTNPPRSLSSNCSINSVQHLSQTFYLRKTRSILCFLHKID